MPAPPKKSAFDFTLEEIRSWGGERQYVEALEQYANKGDVLNPKYANGIGEADIISPVAELGGKGVGETLLTPTKIYVRPMLALMEKVAVRGVSHITGGGFYENIPRSIPDGL